jgi:hypothetical protein
VSAYAGPLTDFIFLGTDSEQYPIQDFQTNGSKSQTITNKQTIDMSTWIHWEIYCPQEAKFSTMSSATVLVGRVQKVIPATLWFGRGVYHGTVKSPNPKSAFTNFTTNGSCTLEGM